MCECLGARFLSYLRRFLTEHLYPELWNSFRQLIILVLYMMCIFNNNNKQSSDHVNVYQDSFELEFFVSI